MTCLEARLAEVTLSIKIKSLLLLYQEHLT